MSFLFRNLIVRKFCLNIHKYIYKKNYVQTSLASKSSVYKLSIYHIKNQFAINLVKLNILLSSAKKKNETLNRVNSCGGCGSWSGMIGYFLFKIYN